MSKTVLTNFRIDADTYKKFRIWCMENDVTVSDHMRNIIDTTIAGELDVNLKKTRRPAKIKESELQDWLSEWD
jgi:hypothetical protein